MCENCQTTQGPFIKNYGITVCKNLKGQVHKENGCTCRVSKCVERRIKLDYERYGKQ